MGVVWKAEDTRLHRHVALKFVAESSGWEADTVDRHLREARAASALNHPGICTVYDIGEWEGRRFIVMEHLEGSGLDERLGEAPANLGEVVELVAQMADALEAAHAKGIVHRDIKPANIFVTTEGQPKILDFGLAKHSAPPDGMTDAGDQTHPLDSTIPGSVMGTAPYMSPEQALGKAVDARTDVFSLGVVLYELITGRRAFAGRTAPEVFDAILNRTPPPAGQFNAEVPAELQRIVEKALQKQAERRHASAAELANELRRLGLSASRATGSASAAARGRILVTGAVVLLGIFLLSQWWPPMGGDSPREEEGESLVSGLKIAVPPFLDTGSDPEHRFFSEGLTAEIVTELSRYGELAVLPCRSGPCEGENVDARQVGEELSAHYVLQGRVQSTAGRIRVILQLFDGRDGRSVWGNTFESDQTAPDLFDLQDELTQQVVAAIAGSHGALARAELPTARRKPPLSLESKDCVFRAYDYLQNHTADTHLAARECLERVVEAEPEYVEGLAWLAYLYTDQYHHRWHEPYDEEESSERAVLLAEKAVSLDDSNQLAHAFLGMAALFAGDSARGVSEMRRAIELNPNNPNIHTVLSNYLALQGDFETATPIAERAMKLVPHPPVWVKFPLFIDHFVHGRYDQALALSNEGVFGNRDFREPLFRAATLGQLGRGEEAAAALEHFRELWGELCRKIGCEGLQMDVLRRELIERNVFSASFADQLIEGLAKAGLPEAN